MEISFARLGILGIGFQYIFLVESVPSVYWIPWAFQACYFVLLVWEFLLVSRNNTELKHSESENKNIHKKFLIVTSFWSVAGFVGLFYFATNRSDPIFWMEELLIGCLVFLNGITLWKGFEYRPPFMQKRNANPFLFMEIAVYLLSVEHILLIREWSHLSEWSWIWVSFVFHLLSGMFENLPWVQFIADSVTFTLVFFMNVPSIQKTWKVILFGTMLFISILKLYHHRKNGQVTNGYTTTMSALPVHVQEVASIRVPIPKPMGKKLY